MTAKELPAGDWRLKVYGHRVSGQDQRRGPRRAEREQALRRQGNRCLYCEIPIGTQIWRGNQTVTLRAHWDHFVPYAYALRNGSSNWVLACHVCNAIKTARVFATVQDAREAILPARARKGYESPESALQRLDLRQTTSVLKPTERQLEALRLIAQGCSTDRAMEEMGIRSRAAFRSMVASACLRLDVSELEEAVKVAAEHGFIPAPTARLGRNGAAL